MSRWIVTCAALLLTATAPAAGAEPRVFASSTERVAVIELYTSEGCSSCPPADRWLSKLRDEPGLWQRIVPLAFHVDYWDYLGWRDRFASAGHSERQRRYAELGRARTVYTPGIFVNGEEWRGFFGGHEPTFERPVVGVLEAAVANGRVELRFAPPDARDELLATVALLGMGLETDVAAGENGGRKLRHDFVVLGDATRRMTATDGRYEATVSLPQAGVHAAPVAIVAWVSVAGNPTPIQAVGGYL